METEDASSFWPVASFAALSGAIISVAVNVVACGANRRSEADKFDKGRAKDQWYDWTGSLIAVNIILNLVGIGTFMYASSFGAVSVAVPSETAVLLLCNLVLQQILEIGEFNLTCLKGTLVLCAATACLKDVGPVVAKELDVFSQIWAPLSLSWLIFTLLVGVVSLLVIHRVQPLKKTEPFLEDEGQERGVQRSISARGFEVLSKERLSRTCAYATFVAVVTALGTTVGKMITQANGVERLECFAVYGLLGFGSLYYGAKAAEECDQSEYLPINECIKLVINAITGLIVWGDYIRYPSTYFMIYVLLCLGAALCAAMDASTGVSKNEVGSVVRQSTSSSNILKP